MKRQFIKASNEYCSFEKHIPAPYLRRSFQLDFVPEKTEISICGLGFYLLYINGKEITKGELAPYISNPDHFCYYDTYDVGPYLRTGENVIGIVLGNGFFNAFGGAVWDFEKTDWIGAPRVALEFCAENGTDKVEFVADPAFKVHPSPIVFDELRMGEHYDASLEIPGWNLPGFDDSAWKNAIPAETPRGEFRLCTAEPIRVIREIKPVAIIKQGDAYLYDFGENTAGVCCLQIEAKPGQEIVMWHGEILDDGKFTNRNIRFYYENNDFYATCNQKDVYIAKGEGRETYTPRFTYHGFRYVLVEGITDGQATKDLLTYRVMNSDLRDIGGFHCSDETVNTLFAMVRRSDLANFYYFPTDCPHREKNGWTGDASMSADHMVMLYDVAKSWHVWLDNIRKAQTDAGALPGIVPTNDWGYDFGSGPAWDSVLFNLPYMLYKYRGDLAVIEENANAMVRYLEYVMRRRNDDGTIAFGLGDWVPVDKDAGDYDAPLALTDSIMVMDIAKKAAEMFGAIGQTHAERFAWDIYLDMRNTIRSTLIDFETMTAKGACQSSQSLALYYGVFEKSEEEQAFARLLEFVHAKNDRFDCGFLGLHVLFHVLSDFGESELAYDMITRKEFPGYGWWIEQGETSIPEQFWSAKDYNGSRNHHFLGDIGRWFMCKLAGLHIVNAETVEIRPAFVRQLSQASGYYDLPKGRVSVSWERIGEDIRMDVDSPDGVECKIVLPAGYSMENGIIKSPVGE